MAVPHAVWENSKPLGHRLGDISIETNPRIKLPGITMTKKMFVIHKILELFITTKMKIDSYRDILSEIKIGSPDIAPAVS